MTTRMTVQRLVRLIAAGDVAAGLKYSDDGRNAAVARARFYLSANAEA